jgi:flagellar biosynthesis/type III secretory pathway protein FliH
MVETNLGVYDARWKTQLEAIEREIQSLMGESLHVP